jgi:hypothetical protein
LDLGNVFDYHRRDNYSLLVALASNASATRFLKPKR